MPTFALPAGYAAGGEGWAGAPLGLPGSYGHGNVEC